MRVGIAVGFVALTAACNTTGQRGSDALGGPPPAEYRAKTLEYMRRVLFDPYSVRDARISQPFMQYGWRLGDAGRAWTVCVQSNAKNRMGAYTGTKDTVVRFQGGVPVDHSDEGSMYFCKGVTTYEPFLEMEAG